MSDYIDLVIRRQTQLEQLKNGNVRNFRKVFPKVEKLIRLLIRDLEGEFSDMTRAELQKLISEAAKEQDNLYTSAIADFTSDLVKLASFTLAQETLDLNNAIDMRGTTLKPFTNRQVYSKVINRPMHVNGDLLEPFIKNFSKSATNEMSRTIRLGHAQGDTNQQIIQRIIGTTRNNNRDGSLAQTRRRAEAMVRTSVQHVASSVRQETWEKNQDVIARYKFVATLDNRTSSKCRSLDQQEFDFGKGPTPPVHVNCRSTPIPVLNEKFSFLSKGRTRASADGPVGSTTQYYGWLKRQPAKVQDEIIGSKRGKLLRSGGLTAERFRKLQFDKKFRPRTLEDMRELEPEAFEKAGL